MGRAIEMEKKQYEFEARLAKLEKSNARAEKARLGRKWKK